VSHHRGKLWSCGPEVNADPTWSAGCAASFEAGSDGTKMESIL
jgi:hypothetical protein